MIVEEKKIFSERYLCDAIAAHNRRVDFFDRGWGSMKLIREWDVGAGRVDFAQVGVFRGRPHVRIIEVKRYAGVSAIVQAYMYGRAASGAVIQIEEKLGESFWGRYRPLVDTWVIAEAFSKHTEYWAALLGIRRATIRINRGVPAIGVILSEGEKPQPETNQRFLGEIGRYLSRARLNASAEERTGGRIYYDMGS